LPAILLMDNLTHTLVGIVAGESVAQAAHARRNLLVFVGAVSSNLPDLDLLVSYRGFERSTLGYLLQHRGYTHTLLGCAALALLCYGCVLLWRRWRGSALSRGDRLAIAAVAVLGVLLHLGMDALNSYGVHPFWPFNNAWYYGDSVFIIEPSYWLAAAPLAFTLRSITARVFMALVVLVALGVSIAMHPSQPGWWIVTILATLALIVVSRTRAARNPAFASVASMLLITALFVSSGRDAALRMQAIATASFPGATTLDTVLTPVPANPSCWDVLLVQTQGQLYSARHGMLALAPAGAAKCPRLLQPRSTTAPMVPVVARRAAEIQWLGEFTMPTRRLALLSQEYCAARELLQFARVPYAVRIADRWVVGDLRFDREAALGMSELALSGAQSIRCHYTVPWLPPRNTLLLD
jgi:inner membrane protein